MSKENQGYVNLKLYPDILQAIKLEATKQGISMIALLRKTFQK